MFVSLLGYTEHPFSCARVCMSSDATRRFLEARPQNAHEPLMGIYCRLHPHDCVHACMHAYSAVQCRAHHGGLVASTLTNKEGPAHLIAASDPPKKLKHGVLHHQVETVNIAL